MAKIARLKNINLAERGWLHLQIISALTGVDGDTAIIEMALAHYLLHLLPLADLPDSDLAGIAAAVRASFDNASSD